MADPVRQVRQFVVTVPSGTAIAAPQSTPLPIDSEWEVKWVELQVPPGPRGQVGFYLASSGTQAVPFRIGNSPQWLTLDNAMPRYDTDPDLNAGDWSVVAYNIGFYSHTFWLRFGLALKAPPVSNVVPLRLIPGGTLPTPPPAA